MTRTDKPPARDERSTITTNLDETRATVLAKCEGQSDENAWLPDRERLIALVAAEGRPVDLSAVTVHDHGWENLVLETSDGWILRFPRAEGVAFQREVDLLAQLSQRFSVEIPQVAWTGRLARYMAYRTLTGENFERDDYLRASARDRQQLARSLSQFLAEMHAAMTTAHADQLGAPRTDHGMQLDLVAGRIDRVARAHRPAVELVLEQFSRMWVEPETPGPPVVLHNDFHMGNMVFCRGELSGVWDFSCVEIGSATLDLRLVDDSPRDLLERVAEAYERATGRRVDVGAAVVANRMENVCDALDTGRAELLDRAVVNWVRSDAGG